MKICLINNLYKPLNRGGAERIVDLSRKRLLELGHNVFIISTKPYFYKGVKNKDVCYLNSLYYNLDSLPKFVRLFWHILDLFDLWHALQLYKIIKEKKPDLIINHNLKGITYLVPFFIKLAKIKNIQILHDIQLLHPSGLLIFGEEKKIESISAKIYQFVCRRLFKYPEIVIAPSAWLLNLYSKKDYFKNAYQDVLPNPVVFNNYSVNKNNSDKSFKFLFVGQLEAHKGVEELLFSFKKALRRDSGLSLSLVGSGSLESKLRKANKGISAIKILGRKNNNEIAALMLEHNCLVVPSLCYENSPTVIYEAASAALPVLAADIGGISELVSYLGGMLFVPDDLDDLSRKLLLAKKNTKTMKTLADEALVKIRSYSLDKYIQRILELF